METATKEPMSIEAIKTRMAEILILIDNGKKARAGTGYLSELDDEYEFLESDLARRNRGL